MTAESDLQERYDEIRRLQNATLAKRAMYDYMQLDDQTESERGMKRAICRMMGMSSDRSTEYVKEHF